MKTEKNSTSIKIRQWSQRHTKRILINFFLFILLSISITCFISYQVVQTMSHHKRDRNVNYELNSKKYPYQKVVFKSTKDNLKLYGYFFSSKKNGKKSEKTIIIVHGYTSNRSVKGRTPKLIQNLVPKGYNVFAFDLRGHGESEGNQITMGVNEKFDLKGAINYVKSRGEEGKKIGVLGFSMGGSIALVNASEDKRIDAVIADSPFRNAGLFLKEQISYFSGLPSFPFGLESIWIARIIYDFNLNSFSPMDAAKSISQPIFLIHGAGDTQIPYENSKIIYKNIKNKNKAEIWYPVNTEHIDAINHYPTEYFKLVDHFFDTYL